ncbi:MAG: PDZ domain-containing protein, partial [Bacteroidota bacterium]
MVSADRSSAQVRIYYPDRTWLGVSVQDVTEQLAKDKDLGVEEGALVNDVFDDSPAEKAGIREGDVIVKFDGRDIDDADDLVRAVRKSKPGKSVQVVVIRDSDEVKLRATLKKRFGRRHAFQFRPRMLRIPTIITGSQLAGMGLQELNKQLGEYFGTPDGRGVLVTEVEEESPAAEAGFKAGDVIVKVEEERVKAVEDIWDGLEDVEEDEKAKFEVIRKGRRLSLELELDEPEDFSFKRFDFWYPEPSGMIIMPEPPKDELEQFQERMERFQEEIGQLQEHLQDMMKKFREKFQNKIRKLQREVQTLIEA